MAIAALPEEGKGRFENWLANPDADIRWILKENLKKNRLMKTDACWVQLMQKALQQNEVHHRKDQRHNDQRRVHDGRDKDRHDQERQRSDDEVDAGIEHQVDFAHVVGGACHRIADRLQVVEGHALA